MCTLSEQSLHSLHALPGGHAPRLLLLLAAPLMVLQLVGVGLWLPGGHSGTSGRGGSSISCLGPLALVLHPC